MVCDQGARPPETCVGLLSRLKPPESFRPPRPPSPGFISRGFRGILKHRGLSALFLPIESCIVGISPGDSFKEHCQNSALSPNSPHTLCSSSDSQCCYKRRKKEKKTSEIKEKKEQLSLTLMSTQCSLWEVVNITG